MLTIVLAFAACEGSEPSGAPDASVECVPSGVTEEEATRTTDAASVTVTARLENALRHCAKDELAFELVLDTHSVDLLDIEMTGAARIETSRGDAPATGFAWAPGSESSHHRDGALTIEAPPLEDATWLRLTVADVAGVDRIFEWDATLLAHDLP